MPQLTILLHQKLTGRGIALGKVYLFEGGGPIEPPENAHHEQPTDLTGETLFEVEGFFRVGVQIPLRFAAREAEKPVEEWKSVWSAWGAVGVARDITYSIPFEWKLIR